MNRQKNFIFKYLILIFFLLSTVISFYFAIDAILNLEFIKYNDVIQRNASDASMKVTDSLNITPTDWWIGVIFVLFGSILIFLIFWIVIISLKSKDKKTLFSLEKQNQDNYSQQMYDNQIHIRNDTYILSESNYHNNVSYRTKEFVPYNRTLHDDYLRNNWWMRTP